MNSEFNSVLVFIRSDMSRMIKKMSTFKSELKERSDPDEPGDYSYIDEMYELLRGVMHTLDDILISATVMWNALFLLHMIHSMNIHISNIYACHKTADAKCAPVFRLDIDHSRVQCHLENILSICRYNLSRMCMDGVPRSTRNQEPSVQRNMYIERAGITGKSSPRSKSPTFHLCRQPSVRLSRSPTFHVSREPSVRPGKSQTLQLSRQASDISIPASGLARRSSIPSQEASVKPVKPERVDPLLQTQLNKMNKLSRKFTSRNLMGFREDISDMLGPSPKHAPRPLTYPPKSDLEQSQSTDHGQTDSLGRCRSR